MRVAIVGAGIMGAANAFHLARMGVDVHVFDSGNLPGQGVTRDAFGWINAINGDPGSEESYSLRIRAIDEYRSLLSAMPELEGGVRRGSLVWKSSAAETVLTASRHEPHAELVLLTAEAIIGEEPQMKKVPPRAIYSPQDIALNPLALVEALLKKAEGKGATLHLRTNIAQIRCKGGTVQGLRTEAGDLDFDRVVLAAGAAIDTLLHPTGISLGVQTSNVVLLRYWSSKRFLANVLSFPELEARQAEDGSLLVVEDYYAGCEEGNFLEPRDRAGRVLNEYFKVPEDLRFEVGAVGQRPTFPDGLPRTGFSESVRGLYFLVGHPGVILAPLLGREAAEEIAWR